MQRQRKAALAVVLPLLILIATVSMIAGFTIFVQDPTLAQGQSGNYSVTMKSTNGYSGSVTVSASNIPQGVSVSFSPNTISIAPNSPATSTMTVSISTIAGPGTYSIVVTGTSSGGQVIQSTTFTLIVIPGVFLSLNPTSGSVSQGNSIETTATISGAPQTVTVSVSGLPSGASASWQQNPITDSQSGVSDALTISTSTSTPTGSYQVTITATGADSQSQSVTYTLTVTQAKYTVQFNQDPLPQGTTWCATLAVAQQCATVSSAGTSSVTFTNILAGAYSWSVPATITSNGVQYSASVSSGTIQLSTSLSVSKTISYSASSYYLTMVAGTGGSVSPSSEWVNAGSQVTITATPNSGHSFNGWSGSGSGSYSGSSSSTTITMNGPITETANWGAQQYLTVSSAHGSTSGQGWYNTGATASFSVSPTTVSCGTGCQYVFASWSGSGSGSYSGSSSSSSVTMNNPITETANWQLQYYLTVNSAGIGSVSGSGWYNAGSVADFGVSPSTVTSGSYRYLFQSFSGAYSGSTIDPSVTMNGPVTETASWTVQQYEQYSSTTPGYYTYSDYYTYSCASGQTLVGTECQTTNTWYTCRSGYTLEGTTCVEQVTTPGYWTNEWVSDTVWNPGYYSCPSGWSLSGSSCSMTTQGYWTQVTTSYTTTSWVNTGSYEVWVSTGGYWTYHTVQDYFCFWSWNYMYQDPQQVCIPWGTTTYATWVETGYWQTVDTGYWLTTTTYVTAYVWNPGWTTTEGASWNPGYWSTTYYYEPVWIDPVTTTYTASPTLNTSVTYSVATATLNTAETWHPPVTNYYWAWTTIGTV